VNFYADDAELGAAALALQAAILYLRNSDTGAYAPVTITGAAPSLTLGACVALGLIPAGAIIRSTLNLYDTATGLYDPITASGADNAPAFSIGPPQAFDPAGLFYSYVKLFDADTAAYVTWQCFNSTNSLS